MSDTDDNFNPNVLIDPAAAERAFQRSDTYSFQGEPITWSERHNWLWLSIARESNWTEEQDALAAMWIGGVQEIDTLKDLESVWRRKPDLVFDQLGEFFDNFFNESDDVQEALGTLHNEILPDLRATHNVLDNEEQEDGEKFGGAPGKSEPAPATSTTSAQPPGSTPIKSVTASRLPKDDSSTPSNCAAKETNSSPQNSPKDTVSKKSPEDPSVESRWFIMFHCPGGVEHICFEGSEQGAVDYANLDSRHFYGFNIVKEP